MNGESRRSRIEAMLRDEPKDVFLRYSLAMEMNSDGDVDLALSKFAELCDDDPPHVPAFFRSAQLLADREQVSEAREFFARASRLPANRVMCMQLVR